MDVERVVFRLVMDAAQYNRAMHAAERDLVRMVDRTARLGPLLSVPFVAAAGAVTGLGVAMGAAAVESVRLASSWEQMNIALKVMTGSAETAHDLLRDVSKLAVESPFKLQGLVGSMKQLAAYGIETENLMPTLARLGDVASGVSRGNLDEMMGRIVLAYGQVRTATRLRGSELRQFTEAGVPMPFWLGKAMGVSPTQIQDFVQEGKVGFSDVVKAFNLMTGKGGRFFEMMSEQSKTVAGVWSNFTETLQLGAMRIGEAFLKTFGIKELLDSWREAVSGTNGQEIDAFFGRLRDVLEEVWTSLKGGYAVVRAAGVTLYSWGEAVYEAVRANKDFFKSLVVLGAAYVGVTYAITAATAAWAAVNTAILVVTSLLNPLGAVVALLGLLVVNLAEFGVFSRMFDTAVAGFERLGETVKEGWGGIVAAVKNNDFETATKIVFKTVELLWRQTVGTMKGVWNDFVYGVFEWQVENFTVFGDKEKILRGLNQLKEERKKDLLDTPDIRRNKAELAGLVGTAMGPGGVAFTSLAAGGSAIGNIDRDFGKLQDELKGDLGIAGRLLGAGKDPTRLGLFRDLGGPDEFRRWMELGRANRMRSEALPLFASGMLQFIFGGRPVGTDGASATGDPWGKIKDYIEPSAPALTLGRQSLEHFAKTEGLGPFDLFNRNLGLLQEAHLGGPAALLGLGGVVGGFTTGVPLATGKTLLNASQYDSALLQQYHEAIKALGTPPGPPPLALRGSVEAQNIINAAQTQQLTVQEQVLQNIEALRALQEAQKEIERQQLEVLREIAGKAGAAGGSGSFAHTWLGMFGF